MRWHHAVGNVAHPGIWGFNSSHNQRRDYHGEITTEDGEKLSLFADGVVSPRKGSSIADIRENVTLFTSSEPYKWVNGLQVWATGTIDLAKQEVEIKGYSA